MTLLAGVATPADALGAADAPVPRDIDGDGHGDLLIGVPLEDLTSGRNAGVVHVVLGGSRAQLRGDMLLRQGSSLGDRPERRDGFGAAVELVDINGDGYSEAVVGVPGESVAGAIRAGVVLVVPGGPEGLLVDETVTVSAGSNGMPGTPTTDQAFGWDLASGDFDDDGFGDIAVSAVGEAADGVAVAGSVTVIAGSTSGLDVARSVTFSQAGPIAGAPEPGDSFGRAVAVGDFDGDGFDDLAIGVPGDDVRGQHNSGAVNVLMGSTQGIGVDRNVRLTQVATRDRPEPDDLFGFSLASADLDCDGNDELAVGAPNEDLREVLNAGVVHVFGGSSSGISTRANRLLAAGEGGLPGLRGNAGFGKAVAGGDFDGDGCGDLAIGAPFATVGPHVGAGNLTVLFGSPSWPRHREGALLTQTSARVGEPAAGTFFASSFSVVDWDGDHRDDLVVGLPGDMVGQRRRAGSVALLFGSRRGLDGRDAMLIDQRGPVAGRPERGDQFGSSLQDAFS